MIRRRTIGLALFLLTLLLYAPARNHDFVNYDDPLYVTENPQVQAGLTVAGVRWAFTTWHASNWHPLTWLSHMLDVELFGVQPGAHHVINVLLHAVNAVLLFLLFHRMTGAQWPAAVVAAFFAWHPLHVESVAWIAERKDVLSTLFWLLTMWFHAESALTGQRRAFWMAAACFALGLLCKPMLVTLPFVLVLMDFWPLGAARREERQGRMEDGTHRLPTILNPLPSLVFAKWPFFLLAAGSCVVTFLAQSGGAVQSFDQVSLGTRLANALFAYAGYLAKTVWPVDLAVFYPLPQQFPIGQALLALLLLAGISAGTWLGRRSRPYLLVGWLWFLGTLVPVIGLVQVGGQAMADRYTYVPMIGLLVMLAWGGRDLLSHQSHRNAKSPLHFPLLTAGVTVATGGALAACAALTWIQQSYWKDSVTLFTQALRVTRNNAVSQINLGIALEQAGRREEALAHYLEALRLEPRRPQVHLNLGNLLDAMGRFDEAVSHYREALQLRPDEPRVYVNLGLAYASQGRWAEAESNYARALGPQDGKVGKWESGSAGTKPPSKSGSRRSAFADPAQVHYLIGVARLRQGRTEHAIASLRETLRLRPDHAKALNQLARILAASPDARHRNGLEATRLAGRAAALTGHQQPAVLDTLGMALAEAGQFEDAKAAAARAIELLESIGETNATTPLRQRLLLYQTNQPYREEPGTAPVQ